MRNILSKRILEADEVSTLLPVKEKLLLIPQNIAQAYEVVAFDGQHMTLAILTTNTHSEALKTVYAGLKKAGYQLEIYYTDQKGIELALTRYQKIVSDQQALEAKQQQQREAVGDHAIKQIDKLYAQRKTLDPWLLVDKLIRYGFQAWASDLHFQVQEENVVLRLRIDGVMQSIASFEHREYKAYLQKLKFSWGLKMNVSKTPQDGRLSFEVELAWWVKKLIDVRMSLMPGLHNLENIVLRYLDSEMSIRSFEDLGFWGKSLDQVNALIKRSEGMILITWPTWSGKTTTLYTMLQRLNDGSKKIITLEDPIEYKIDGIEQSQINHEHWYGFEKGLEAILRHDPDIILVGETRSAETAKTSLNAALTWHLVFSTLHTNSALDAIPRLLMMGVEAYLLAPSLQAILAQRLLRKACIRCASSRKATEQEHSYILTMLQKIQDTRPDLELSYDGTLTTTSWCEACNGTGYHWRVAAIEFLELTPTMKTKIVDDLRNTAELMSLMRNNWFLTLQEDALLKMLQGKTTFEEIRKLM